MSKDYPLHPGQTEMSPQFVQLPLENYEAISRELAELRTHEVEWDLAKARIKELEAEIPHWRKFSDKKPEHHQWVLVFYPNHSRFTTGVDLRRWDEGLKFDVEMQEIYTYWMPLPKEPEYKQ